MPNDEVRELLKSIMDVREWLARLDAKLDTVGEVKETANQAEKTADKALALAKENAREIEEMKANNKWIWGTLISVAALMATVLIAILN